MRQKLLYFLITIFGTATLVSGYLWNSEVQNQNFKIPEKEEEIIREVKIDDEQNKTEPATTYQLPLTTQTVTTSTGTEPDTPTTTEINQEEIFKTKITLQINGKNLHIPYQENLSAESAMKDAHSRYPESFWYESIEYGGDLGTFVKSINGIAENTREKMYWILYINGKKSNKGISTLILNPNDIIMWNYEKEIL